MKRNLKILLVGDSNVGKTNLLERITTGKFQQTYSSTLGVEVSVINKNIIEHPEEELTHNLSIWDCGGDSSVGPPKEIYFKHANGAIVMFDATNRSSFESVKTHIQAVRSVCGGIPIVVCGNKSDLLVNKVLGVKYKEINKLCKELEVDAFYYTSSKSCHNFEAPFRFFLVSQTKKTEDKPIDDELIKKYRNEMKKTMK